MKKSITFLASVLLISFAVQAQMKIGTPTGAPNASSILDISNTGGGNKGLLPPMVVLTGTNVASPVTSPADGLMVYNTTAGGSGVTAVTVGYYYWSATLSQWVSFSSSAINNNDLRAVGTNGHITQDAGAGSNGTGIGTGTDDIAIGNGAMNGITSGQYNVGIGTNALAAIGSGTRSVAVGYNALIATTVSNNTGVGYRALAGTTTGTGNVGIGNSVLAGNTTGGSNTAAGFSTLGNNTTGSDNTGIGAGALNLNAGGIRNTAVGSASLANNTANQNTAVGYNTLNANTTGSGNTALGARSLAVSTTGANNTGLGFIALALNTTGIENTAVGSFGMNNITSGNGNTGVGIGTLGQDTSGSNNTAFGNRSLPNIFFGDENTGLGHLAGNQLLSGSNNTAIGANTQFASNSASNQLNIGNNIFGTGLTGNVSLPAGNIGIGTVSPNSTLQVAGSTALGYAELTASTTLSGIHHFVNVNSASATTITLPIFTGILGREYIIRNTGAGTVSIVVSGGSTINAGSNSFATLSATAGQTYTLYAGSTNWQALLNVTNISTLGAATALQSMVIPAANQGLAGGNPSTAITMPGSGGAVNIAFDKSGNYTNSITGADFTDATDVISLPAGTYQVIWNFVGIINMPSNPSNLNLFWDVPDGASGTHRVHYASGSTSTFNPYGLTFVTTMQITAARTFNFAIGSGNGNQASTFAVAADARLAFIKLQ